MLFECGQLESRISCATHFHVTPPSVTVAPTVVGHAGSDAPLVPAVTTS